MVAKLVVKAYLDPNGLKNKGNTCFFNASIQCLISLPKVVRYFLDNTFDPLRQPFSSAIQNFIFEYKNHKIVDPSDFIDSIKGKIKLFDGRQQDAHAFLECLITRLTDECDKGQKTLEKSNFMKDAFGITLEDTVRCHCCEFTTNVSTFSLIQYLFIKETVQKSIEFFIHNVEMIDSSSPWRCTGCGKRSESSIKHHIKHTSDYVILHLNRFQSITAKNNVAVAVDEVIKINDTVYENVGIVCHVGSLSGGHYFSYAKRDDWSIFNDSSVQKAERPVKTNLAYILFYSRKQ